MFFKMKIPGVMDNPLFSDNVTGLLQLEHGGNQWTGIFDFLKGNQLIKVLAEPTLIALSGQTANFLAGGEFPIPSIDDEGNVGVEFKPYGVNLMFTPTVLSEKRIAIKVQPVISELDFSISRLSIGGAVVPGILSRSASTMVELGDGQSFCHCRHSSGIHPGEFVQISWLGRHACARRFV